MTPTPTDCPHLYIDLDTLICCNCGTYLGYDEMTDISPEMYEYLTDLISRWTEAWPQLAAYHQILREEADTKKGEEP